MIRHEEFDTASTTAFLNKTIENEDNKEFDTASTTAFLDELVENEDNKVFDTGSTTIEKTGDSVEKNDEFEESELDISDLSVSEAEFEENFPDEKEANISDLDINGDDVEEKLDEKLTGEKVSIFDEVEYQEKIKEDEQARKKEKAIIALSGATKDDLVHQREMIRDFNNAKERNARLEAEQKAADEKRKSEHAEFEARIAPVKNKHGETNLRALSFEDFVWWGVASLDSDGDKKKEFGPIVTCLKQVHAVMEKINAEDIEDSRVIELMYSGVVGAVAAAKHYLSTHASMLTWSQYGRDRKAFCRIITEPAFMDRRCAEIGISKNPNANEKKNKGEHEYVSQWIDMSVTDIEKRIEEFRSSLEDRKELLKEINNIDGSSNSEENKKAFDLFLAAKEQSLKDKDGKLISIEAYIVLNGLAGKTPKEMLADKKFKELITKELKKENFQTGLDYTRNRVSYENGSITAEEYSKNLRKINKNIEDNDALFVEKFLNAVKWEENVDTKDDSKNVVDSKGQNIKKMERAAYRTALLELVHEIRFSPTLNDSTTSSGLENIGYKEDMYSISLQPKSKKTAPQRLTRREQAFKNYQEASAEAYKMKKKYEEINFSKNAVDSRKRIENLLMEMLELENEYGLERIDCKTEKNAVSLADAKSGLAKNRTELENLKKKNGKSKKEKEKEIDELTALTISYKDKKNALEKEMPERLKKMGIAMPEKPRSLDKNYEEELENDDLGKNHFYDDLVKNDRNDDEFGIKPQDFDKDEEKWEKTKLESDPFKWLGDTIGNFEKQIKELQESIAEEEKIQREIYKFDCWMLFYEQADYQEIDKKATTAKVIWKNAEIEEKKRMEVYKKEDMRENSEFRKMCGGLTDEEEKTLCESIVELIKSGKTDKKSKRELNRSLSKIIFSYFLRSPDSDDEDSAILAVDKLVNHNIRQKVGEKLWKNLDNYVDRLTLKTWTTVHNNYINLKKTVVDNTNTGFEYSKEAYLENAVKKVNDAVRIQANRGDYGRALKIFQGLQNDVFELGRDEWGEKKSFKDAYKDIMEYMADNNLSDTVSLEEYISKGNEDFTEFMSDEGTTLDLNTLTADSVVDFEDRKNNLIRDVSPIEQFIRLVMIEKINGEYISTQLLAGGEKRELFKIAAEVHNANMAYINAIDSFFKQRNGFSLVDMTFVENWQYSSKNEEYHDEAMANRRKYEEYKRSVNNKLMDYRRNPSSSKDVGDVARVGYDNIQNNPDANMNIQTKPADNNKTQPAVNKNIRLDDAEQRTLRKNYEKYGMRMTSGYHVKDMNNAERKSLEESRQKYFIHYTEEVLSKMRYEELIEAKNFFKTIEAQELDDYKIIVEEIKKRDEEQKEVEWLRTQAFYADDL